MRRKTVLYLLGVLFMGLFAYAFASRAPNDLTTVVLDPNTRYQTIDGWAVYPRYWEDDKKNDRFDRSIELYVEEVSKVLVDKVGINAVRLEIWSGLENPKDYWIDHYEGRDGYHKYARHRYEKVNDNDDPYTANPAGFQFSKFDHRIETMTLPIKKALEARGEKLYVNVTYVDFSWKNAIQGPLRHADQPEEFAEFVLVFFQRLRDKYGIIPDSFEVILEPENTKRWRGEQIGRGLVAVAKRLEANGFTPEFVAPSNTSMRTALSYFDEMIRVPKVLDYLDTFSYHRYGLQTTAMVRAVHSRAERHGLKTAMLEWIKGDIDVLMEDLLIGQVSSWQQWAAAGRRSAGDKGVTYVLVDRRASKSPRVSLSGRATQLAQVFNYVRRGAVRIAGTSDNADKTCAVFINKAGDWVVVIRAKKAGGPIRIENLPGGTYGLRFVDDTMHVEKEDAISIAEGKVMQWIIPRPGVLTIHAVGR